MKKFVKEKLDPGLKVKIKYQKVFKNLFNTVYYFFN